MQRLLLILSILILLLAGCKGSGAKSARFTKYDDMIDHSKPIAFGEDELVHVFCGDETWKFLEPHLGGIIEREIGLVYNEKYFRMQRVDIKDISSLSKFKNLVFFGDLTSEDAVSQYMTKSLATEFIERVQSSGGDMFVAKNHWVRDQLVIYLLGKDRDSLLNIAGVQANQMFSKLLERYTMRLAYQAYLSKVLPEAFWEHYPFTMQIPETYRLYSNDKVNRFVSFIYRARQQNREIPDKYISIYYEDMPENLVDQNWVIAKRREIGTRHFEGDIIEDENLRVERFSFAGYEGWRILGPWKNLKHMVGGGFQAHGFWDPQSKRAYLVDNSVFFPAGDKLPSLLELYMISSTFRIKRD